ncbi:MAG: hypothetical protein LBR60_06975 [Fibrobacter sp.]|nr:hypothetical protein [Fibrobacter sp.]
MGFQGTPGVTLRKQILFSAGEDSGDILGETAVAAALALGFRAAGAGGARMNAQGLESLVPYEELPVSGFGDVLPRYFRLKKHLKTLESALANPECKAFVAIDYPGFNMRLKALAEKLGKPVFYIAPPQIWAWKAHRGAQFQGTPCAVLYSFEEEIYRRHGALVSKLNHPFEQSSVDVKWNANSGQILFLPGSRLKAALRNLSLYVSTAQAIFERDSRIKIIFGVSREALYAKLREKIPPCFSVEVLPAEAHARALFFAECRSVLAVPGTAHAEAFLCGVPSVAASRVELLTYLLGKKFLKTPFLTVPNLVTQQPLIPEHYIPAGKSFSALSHQIAAELVDVSPEFQESASKYRFHFQGIPLENWIRERLEVL